MLICHNSKVIFICIPHTASTQIAEVLRENGFIDVREKHSLPYFIPKKYKDYQVIGGYVDPLVDLTTMYWKFRNDHLGLYSEAMHSKLGRHKSLGRRGRKFFNLVNKKQATLDEFVIAAAKPFFISQINAFFNKYTLIYNRENLESDWIKIRNLCELHPGITLKRGNTTEKGTSTTISDDAFRYLLPQREKMAGTLNLWSARGLAFFVFVKFRCALWLFRELLRCLRSRAYRNMEPR